MTSRSKGQSSGEKVLWKSIRDNHADLIQDMDTGPTFLRNLVKSGLLTRDDMTRLERQKDVEGRNSELLQTVLENECDVQFGYDKFIDALSTSNQEHLADLLNGDPVRQTTKSRDVDDYLNRESRRAQIKYDPRKKNRDDDDDDDERGDNSPRSSKKRQAGGRSRSKDDGGTGSGRTPEKRTAASKGRREDDRQRSRSHDPTGEKKTAGKGGNGRQQRDTTGRGKSPGRDGGKTQPRRDGSPETKRSPRRDASKSSPAAASRSKRSPGNSPERYRADPKRTTRGGKTAADPPGRAAPKSKKSPVGGQKSRSRSLSPDRPRKRGKSSSPTPVERGGRERGRAGRSDGEDEEEPEKEDPRKQLRRPDEGKLKTAEQLERARGVIDKLHNDCEDVARKHADVLDKLRQVDTIVQKVLPEPPGGRSNSDADGPRSKQQQDEAERIVATVRDRLTNVGEQLRDDERRVSASEQLVDRMRRDVAERNRALVELEAADRKAAFRGGQHQPLPSISASATELADGGGDSAGGHKMARLKSKLTNLSSELASYVHREKQSTNNSRARDISSHRNFDQIDHELNMLHRELRQKDRSTSLMTVQRLTDVTKSERDDCLRLIDDLQRLVQKRRVKIQEVMTETQLKSGLPSGPTKQAPVLPRKMRSSRSVDSNVSRRLADFGDEVKLFMEVEFEHGQKLRDDFARRRQELDDRARASALEIKRLERLAADANAESQRYRRLYEKEQAVNVSRTMLTRTTAVKRTSTRGRRSKSLDPLPSTRRGRQLSTIKDADEPLAVATARYLATERKNEQQRQKQRRDDDVDEAERYGRRNADRTPSPPRRPTAVNGGDTQRSNYDSTGNQTAVHIQTTPHHSTSADYDDPGYDEPSTDPRRQDPYNPRRPDPQEPRPYAGSPQDDRRPYPVSDPERNVPLRTIVESYASSPRRNEEDQRYLDNPTYRENNVNKTQPDSNGYRSQPTDTTGRQGYPPDQRDPSRVQWEDDPATSAYNY